MKSIIVLGINDGHDAGSALIRDGRILAAVQEERLTNIKHQGGIPSLSIQQVYRTAKVDPTETDAIALVSLIRVQTPEAKYPLKIRAFEKISPLVHSKTFANAYVALLNRFRGLRELKKVLSNLSLQEKEIVFVEHHTAHAACAYRTSPWGYQNQVLVMTCDGAGDGLSSTVSIGDKGELKRIAYSTYYDSLGNSFYSEITRYLGLKPWDHEYKVMGLAPYGKQEYCLEKMKKVIRLNPKNPLEFQNIFGSYLKSMQPGLRKLLACERFDNIAAACQAYYEELFVEWVKAAVKKTGIHRVAFAGGNILNVKANKKVLEMEEVDDAFFFPPAGDEGTPIGAALEVYYALCLRDGLRPEFAQLEDLYYGPEYNDEEILSAITSEDLRAERYEGTSDEVAGELVSKGEIVARYSGRTEFGPRGLGNRSIIADARKHRVIGEINTAIKQRDFWMPFAPSILEERYSDYLIDPRPARYMILGFDTTSRGREDLAAAIHPQDFTARPQTLNHWNPGYRKMIETFEKSTGVGGVLNTSFNLHGYPIVGTPELAIWTLKNSGLEYLVLGNYLVKKHS